MRIVKNSRGMSLVEILIASAMTLICVVATVSAYITVANWAEMNRQETVAMLHLSSVMEAVKSTTFGTVTQVFPGGIADGPNNSNSYAAIVGGYSLKNEHITVSYVDPAADPLEITAAVGWTTLSGANRSRSMATKRTQF